MKPNLSRSAMMEVISRVYNHPKASNRLMENIYANSDGYGEIGLIPPQGYDWSGIRDSSAESVAAMYRIAASSPLSKQPTMKKSNKSKSVRATKRVAKSNKSKVVPLSVRVAKDAISHKSSVKNPCQQAWEIFSGVKTGKRKDAIEAAMKGGIAYYTARTQYQLWKQAGDNDKKAAARSAK